MATNAGFTKTQLDDKAKHILETSLRSVNSCISNRNYGRAFAHYLLIFKLDPCLKDSLKSDFTYAMREWTEELERHQRIGDLFKCYEQACDVYPECETALNNIGAQLFRLGYIDEGAIYIRKALRLAPDYVAARQNLENICSYLVDRWHFRMLNDVTRNKAYRQAILNIASKGANSILDIGSGTGLLSLYAMESGMTTIYACEESKTMNDVAQDVLGKNDTEKKIKLICKNSTDLMIPDDLPERVDVIVTETFDAGLFGEGILTTLLHAFKHLLKPQQESGMKQQIIPGGASVYICAVEAESLRSRNRSMYPVLQNVDLDGISIVCKTTLTEDDPYTTEDLSRLRGGYTELSAPYKLLQINLNDVTEIEKLINQVDFTSCLPVTKTGRLDAIVLWFDLHLDEEVTVTTRPDTSNCWEQAVYPVLPQHFLQDNAQHHLDVRIGDEIEIRSRLKDNSLNITCNRIKTTIMETDQQSAKISKRVPSLSDQDLMTFQLEHHEVTHLNDINTNRVYFHAMERLRLERNRNNLAFLDFSQGLSPLGVQAALLGYTEVCVVCEEDRMTYVKCLCNVNGVNDQVKVESKEEVLCGEERYDVIISEMVESCGVLKQQILEDLALLRVTSLAEDGILLPCNIKIYGICVESHDLLRVSRVIGDEETSGYQISEFINDFQSTTQVDIDLHTLPHSKLTESFLMFDFTLNPDAASSNQPPCFLEQTSTITANILQPGQLTAVVYWFDLTVLDNLKVSTLDYTSHWKQAAIMIKDVVALAGENIELEFHLENSCIELKSYEIKS